MAPKSQTSRSQPRAVTGHPGSCSHPQASGGEGARPTVHDTPTYLRAGQQSNHSVTARQNRPCDLPSCRSGHSAFGPPLPPDKGGDQRRWLDADRERRTSSLRGLKGQHSADLVCLPRRRRGCGCSRGGGCVRPPPLRGACFFPHALLWGAASGPLFSEAEDSGTLRALQTHQSDTGGGEGVMMEGRRNA